MLLQIPGILCLLSVSVVVKVDCRKEEMTQRTRAYLDAFRNIPRLFDYLLETLDERPEILENNDAEVFKRDTEDTVVSNVYLFKRDVDYDDVTDFEAADSDDNMNYVYSDETFYTNNENDDYIINENYDEDEDEESNENIVYHGSEVETSTLTADEVAENALKIEQMLEEHNNRK